MGEVLAKDVTGQILKVENLRVYYYREGFFFSRKKPIRAVDGVSFSLKKGEVLGLVGESGCGKSTIARGILRLVEPAGGRVEILGVDFLSLRGRRLRQFRRHIQMVFQDPYTSLNPRMRAGYAVEEPLIVHGVKSKKERREMIEEMFKRVGLHPEDMKKYPHEFSGGQRQRIAIARAIILRPDIVVADEPTSALDVSVQAQIINLFLDLKEEFDLSYVFISHDLRLVHFISNRIAVMYLGRFVETGPAEDIITEPLHPYTRALISAVPRIDGKSGRKRIVLPGEVPSPENPPSGCPFHPRCPERMPVCSQEEPVLKNAGGGREVACFLYQ